MMFIKQTAPEVEVKYCNLNFLKTCFKYIVKNIWSNFKQSLKNNIQKNQIWSDSERNILF